MPRRLARYAGPKKMAAGPGGAAWWLSDRPAAWPGADRAGKPTAVVESAAARGEGHQAGVGLVRLASPLPIVV